MRNPQSRLTASSDRRQPVPTVATAVLLLAGSFMAMGARRASAQMNFSLDEADQAQTTQADPNAPTTTAQDPAAPAQNGDVISDLAATPNSDATGASASPTERRAELTEDISSVSRIYALRTNRVELAPNVGFTINDQYVSHPSIGAVVNYWFTHVLAVGVNFNWYQFLESESDLAFNVRRSTRLAVPITQYQLGLNLNFSYVPLYGKFAMFNQFIFEYDIYVVAGVGVMRTRPVPVVDPEIRRFDFDWRVSFNVGIGLRVFITRWLAAYLEFRDYMYLEQLENNQVALGAEARTNPNSWLAEGPSFTNNVTTHLGVTFFLPPTFEYRFPR